MKSIQLEQQDKSRWCYECRRQHHKGCTGRYRLGHGVQGECRCPKCATNTRKDDHLSAYVIPKTIHAEEDFTSGRTLKQYLEDMDDE